ncbi:MAG TPA: hypothetical protein VGI84_11605 [Pseudonocardiaceae bacterium]
MASGRLVIMGSGETAPTMVEVHRAVLAPRARDRCCCSTRRTASRRTPTRSPPAPRAISAVRARQGRDFATSDAIRDALGPAGIRLRDTTAGTEWDLA